MLRLVGARAELHVIVAPRTLINTQLAPMERLL